MSCTYYLRDRKITNKIIDELKVLEEDFNTKLNKLYEELNNRVASILPINNEDVIEREFGAFNPINDNYPKYVISLDKQDYSRDGIIHINLIDWLMDNNF